MKSTSEKEKRIKVVLFFIDEEFNQVGSFLFWVGEQIFKYFLSIMK